jgi:hypothetical protein
MVNVGIPPLNGSKEPTLNKAPYPPIYYINYKYRKYKKNDKNEYGEYLKKNVMQKNIDEYITKQKMNYKK